jgi:hypothetical protein
MKEKFETSSNIDIFILIEEPNMQALEFVDKNLDLFWSGEKPMSKYYDNTKYSSQDAQHQRSIFIRGAGNSNKKLDDKNSSIATLGNHLAIINVAALNTDRKRAN